MTRAIAAETQVAYVAEVTENTTPATPAFKVFRCTGETSTISRNRVSGSELRGRRGELFSVIAANAGEGSWKFEMSHATLDDFLEAALRNTWSTNVLTDANIPKTFTLETKFETGTDVYKRFTGAQLDTFDLEFSPDGLVTGNVAWMSRGSDFTSSGVTGATYTAPNNNEVHVGGNFSALTLTGITVDCFTALTLNLKNNLRAQRCLGNFDPAGLAAGKLEITGSFSIFLDVANIGVLNAFEAGTPTGLDFKIGAVANERLRFEMPNVVLEQITVNAESAEGDVIATVPFRVLQASTLTQSAIRVSRNQA